jgi:thiamine pyrophosphokinase
MEAPVRAIIIAGGKVRDGSVELGWVEDGDLVIGADGGAAQALKWGLQPQLVIGDMDSLPADLQQTLADQGSQFVIHHRAKDETDMELALTYAAQQGVDEIVVLGALGGRLDHTLANILLLVLPQLQGIVVRIVDGNQEARLVQEGQPAYIEGKPGDLVSLLPLGSSVRGVTTDGLAWTLSDDSLDLGFTRGVSNVMTSPLARVEARSGLLLVLHGPPEEH